jgi:hypothetical protein
MPLTVTPTNEEQQAPPEEQQGGEAKPFYSKQIPDPPKEGEEWKQFVPQALRGLYPHLRAGEDYVWGKKDFDGDDEMIHWDEKYAPVDMGKVEEIARKLADNDPYLSYEPKPPLHAGSKLGAGEQPKATDMPYEQYPSPETPNETYPEQPTEP